MKKIYRGFMPLGMVGALFYIAHTIIGQILWKAYNPITTDISSLTADGAPNRNILSIFCNVYSVCMILFLVALIKKAFDEYNLMCKIGYIVLMIMQLTSTFGYSLFPLSGDKTVMNFQNVMHITVTIIVVFTTITSSFLIAVGYLKQKNTECLGRICLIMAILITIFGATVPISMNLRMNILGLTERLEIYTIQIFMIVLSYNYTFIKKVN
ncbi:DUF998 domain-containing protein [Clostridium hydrogenum]|uniref:DUF998 domain-containing protein n=1 Tax=Clostridium hydrogenum TaxID=2855764 RepID=UPI001F172E2C|nr:DUF998 domain-containing protein [Clostridium hydrogenum]